MNEIKKYSGFDWLSRQQYAVKIISELGRDVADVLGQVYAGIYHLGNTQLFHKRTDWSDERRIEIIVSGTLTLQELDILVVESRNRNVYVEIDGAANRYIRFAFWRAA